MDNHQRRTPSTLSESPAGQIYPPHLRDFSPHAAYNYGSHPEDYNRQRHNFSSHSSRFDAQTLYNNENPNGTMRDQDFYPEDPYNTRPYQIDPSFISSSQDAGGRHSYGHIPSHNAGNFHCLPETSRFSSSPPQGAEISQYAAQAHSHFEEHPSNPSDGTYDEGSESHYPEPDPDYREDRQSEDEGSEYVVPAFGDNEDDGSNDKFDVKVSTDLNYSYAVNADSYTSYRAIIKNEAHYDFKKDERRNNDTKNKKEGGKGFPKTNDEKLSWVGRLFEAIKNMDNVTDQPGKDDKLPQAVVRIREGFYEDEHIEKVCWSILVSSIHSKLI